MQGGELPMDVAFSIDSNRLSAFIRELNVARQFISTYPANHPLLVAAEEKVAHLGHSLLADSGAFTLGVTKDGLLLIGEELDPHNASFQTFSRLLAAHGVATISFLPGLETAELHLFNLLTSKKPDLLRSEGGIAAALRDHADHLLITEINYQAFSVVDGLTGKVSASPTNLWTVFVKSLLAGVDSAVLQSYSGIDMDDVESLTRIVSELGDTDQLRGLIGNYSNALFSFSQKTAENQEMTLLINRISQLINELSPELRSQFLQNSVSSLANSPAMLCEIIKKLNPDVVLESLNQLSAQGTRMPAMVLGLLKRLRDEKNATLPSGLLYEQETASRLRELFREDDLDAFLPTSYQEVLHKVLLTRKSASDSSLSPDLQTQMESMSEQFLEARTGSIIIEIMKSSPDADTSSLQKNLEELCGYFLEIGDFASLSSLHVKLVTEGAADPRMSGIRDSILYRLATPEFVDEVINGLSFWGKSKYEDIRSLIAKMGHPFIEPLLEKLATEQSMSLRRFYMDRLLEIGPDIESHLLTRLRDNRWFYVRNLLILLRGINNPQVCRQLHRLIQHPHPKVRQETLRTLIYFGDREADQMLSRHLESNDEETLYTAIQLAEKSSNPSVLPKLLSFLDKGTLTNYEYRLKSAVVASLGEIGKPSVLPRLEKILFSGTLLHAAHHNRLKGDILRTLHNYPPADVIPILKKIVQSGSDDLIRQAEEVYRALQRKQHGSPAEN